MFTEDKAERNQRTNGKVHSWKERNNKDTDHRIVASEGYSEDKTDTRERLLRHYQTLSTSASLRLWEFEDWHFLKVVPLFFALVLLHDSVVNPESVAHLKRFVAANFDRRL